MRKLMVENVTKDNVRSSEFGCRNCLWCSIECTQLSKFEPKVTNNVPSCKAYTYYD